MLSIKGNSAGKSTARPLIVSLKAYKMLQELLIVYPDFHPTTEGEIRLKYMLDLPIARDEHDS